MVRGKKLDVSGCYLSLQDSELGFWNNEVMILLLGANGAAIIIEVDSFILSVCGNAWLLA
jgi:shikimate 5-dehydrogenase